MRKRLLRYPPNICTLPSSPPIPFSVCRQCIASGAWAVYALVASNCFETGGFGLIESCRYKMLSRHEIVEYLGENSALRRSATLSCKPLSENPTWQGTTSLTSATAHGIQSDSVRNTVGK